MKNMYEIRGDVTVIFIESRTYGRIEVLIDTDKLSVLHDFFYSWTVKFDNKNKTFYVRSAMKRINGKQQTMQLHRLLTDAPIGYVVDHIDHNGLNNTLSNLRIVTHAQNMQNRKKAQSNSFTGVRGVSEYKAKGKYKNAKKYVARVGIPGMKHQKTIGYFNSIEEANKAVKLYRLENMPYSTG